MKKILLILLLGAVLGAVGWHYYESSTVAERARETTAHAKTKAVASARTVGERLEDAGIIALIKGKYVMDKELSMLAIGVECRDGHVTLRGSVESPEHIARATEIARQTKGVAGVSSVLTVKN